MVLGGKKGGNAEGCGGFFFFFMGEGVTMIASSGRWHNKVTCPPCQGSRVPHAKGQVTLGHSKNSGFSVIREGERPREPYR